MAEIIRMPRLSDTMTDGVVATWLKKVGDKISEGDILAEIETDKATMEFESFHSGTLLYVGIQEGKSAPVDSLLAIVGEEGEDFSELLNNKSLADSVKAHVPKVEESKAMMSSILALPEGVEVITMPRLSDTMTDGTVATWLKKVGDKVSEGDILAEIETDKATMEFESFYSGTILYIGIQEGESAPVDNVLAILGPEGTNITGIAENYKKTETIIAPAKEAKASITVTPSVESINVKDKRLFISPLAKKIAEEKGIKLSQVKGSGENGRIIKRDIEGYKPQIETNGAPVKEENTRVKTVESFVTVGETYIKKIKNSQMRKTIARRLSESKFTAPHYYLTIEVAMDNAMVSRSVINSLPDTKVSFNDMVIKASAMALKKHPQVNSQWTDDVTIINHHINIGVAVAVEDGLVVPVLKFTDQLTLSQIGANVKDLAGRARNKKLQPTEMDGSTFTVSNLGMFGITEFTSIINQPNSAILSVGAIVEKPVVRNNQIVVGNTMKITLACDHRTVDGATGAQFLQTLRQYLENPVTMLA